MIKFGTDGWRGIIADDFTISNVKLVAQAHAQHLKVQTSPRVVIGYDTRFAGRLFAQTVARVMAANGVEVFLCDEAVPTPVLSHAVKHLSATGGVMITASHNPSAYNGYKIKGSYGGTATPNIITAIEYELANLEQTPEFHQHKHQIQSLNPSPAYFQSLCQILDLEKIGQFKGTIIHDAMGGAGAGYLERFLQYAKLAISFQGIRNIADPMFYGINPEPIPANLVLLEQHMRSQPPANFAVITDGDADRVGVMLPNGVFFNSHQIFAVLLDHLHQKGLRGQVIKTVSGSQLIDALAKNRNLELLETPIGFKYITDAMLSRSVLIGGEESGGFGVQGHLPERDGILNALLLLEACATRDQTLGEIFAQLETETGLKHAYDRIDLHLTSPITRAELKARLKTLKVIADLEIIKFDYTDGVKIFLTNYAWILFRPSGTEPMLRIYSEAQDLLTVQQILAFGRVFFTDQQQNQGVLHE